MKKETFLSGMMLKKNIKQEDLANVIGKSRSVVSRKLNGKVIFTATEKATIAKYLEMTDAEKIIFFSE